DVAAAWNRCLEEGDGFFDLSTWIAAIIGSVILLALYRVFTGRSHRGGHAHA
ncbi:GlsB/YeaQ/YmgE family stress response membrane protein, partial [Streptomyces cellulosae]